MHKAKTIGLSILALIAAQSVFSESSKSIVKKTSLFLVEGVPAILPSGIDNGPFSWHKNGRKLNWETNSFIRIDYPLNGDAGLYTVRSGKNTSILDVSFKSSISILLNDQEVEHGRLEADSFSVVKLVPYIAGLPIRYTLDGSEPTEKSELYVAPIQITNSIALRAKISIPETESASVKIIDDKGL